MSDSWVQNEQCFAVGIDKKYGVLLHLANILAKFHLAKPRNRPSSTHVIRSGRDQKDYWLHSWMQALEYVNVIAGVCGWPRQHVNWWMNISRRSVSALEVPQEMRGAAEVDVQRRKSWGLRWSP